MTYAYTPETLAAVWEVSAATVRSLVREGTLRAFRVGRQIRIRPADVTAYEEAQCKNGASNSTEASTPQSEASKARPSASRLERPIFKRQGVG